MQTNSYTADLGQAAFGQVSLITKSGTNSLHGALFEFWRNNKFDARNTFLPKAEPPEPQPVRRGGGRPDLAEQEFLLRQLRTTHGAARRGIFPLRACPGVARRRFFRRRGAYPEGSRAPAAAVRRAIASRRTSSARPRTPPSPSGPSRTSAVLATRRQNLLVTAPGPIFRRHVDRQDRPRTDRQGSPERALLARSARRDHHAGPAHIRADHPAAQSDHPAELDPHLQAGAAGRIPRLRLPDRSTCSAARTRAKWGTTISSASTIRWPVRSSKARPP